MRVLLDTNALIWQLGISAEKSKIGPHTRELMQTAEVVYVSSISIVECHVKTMLGRLHVPEDFREEIVYAGDTLLDLSAADADIIRCLPELSRHDPFDRMLVAQAKTQHLTLLTADALLLDLGLPFVKDCRK